MQKGTEAMLSTVDDTIKDVLRAFLLLKTDESATFAAEMLRDSAEQLKTLANIIIREECASFAGIQEKIRYIQQFDEDSQKIKKLKLNMRLSNFGLYYDWEKQSVFFMSDEEDEAIERKVFKVFEGNLWLYPSEVKSRTALLPEVIKKALDSLVKQRKLDITMIGTKRHGELPVYHLPEAPVPIKYGGDGKIVLKRGNPNWKSDFRAEEK